MTNPIHQAKSPAANFFLLGEEPRPVEDRFAHLEALQDRSRPSGWHIHAHTHDSLNHLFYIRAGAGIMTADGRNFSFLNTSLIAVPSQCVHAFEFQPETEGIVMTIGEPLLRTILTQVNHLGGLFDGPAVCVLEEQSNLEHDLDKLNNELSWNLDFGAAAIEARLTSILIETARAFGLSKTSHTTPHNRNRWIAAKYRRLLEQHFRQHLKVDEYATMLGIGPATLRRACLNATGRSSAALAQERCILEAKRSLAYTNRTIAQIGYSIGYEDPAYFSRFFTQQSGLSPRQYRANTHASQSANMKPQIV